MSVLYEDTESLQRSEYTTLFTLHQSINVVLGESRSLFWDSYKTHKRSVSTM